MHYRAESMGEGDKKNQPSTMTGRGKAPGDRIVWHDSPNRTFRADVTEVTMGREEIHITFGAAQPQAEDLDKLTVSLLGRTVLTPFMAKRFAIALHDALQGHEAIHGPIGPDFMAANDPSAPAGERASSQRSLLLGLINGLHVEFGFERSFKIFRGALLTNRFLLSLHRDAIPREKMLDLCRNLGLPDVFWAPLLQNLPDTKLVHFGFEENEKGSVYKVYLELSLKSRFYPFLLYLGFKWDPSDHAAAALARYTCYPSLTPKDMTERLSAAFDGPGAAEPLEIAKGIVTTASAITQDILYLDVTEDNNRRSSFDINMYRAGLRLEALYPLLIRMRDHYSIPSKQFHAFFEASKGKKFGHLSGGTDREGRDFFTIYFGVEEH